MDESFTTRGDSKIGVQTFRGSQFMKLYLSSKADSQTISPVMHRGCLIPKEKIFFKNNFSTKYDLAIEIEFY